MIRLFKAFVEWSSYALSRLRRRSSGRRCTERGPNRIGMHSPDVLCSGSRVKGGSYHSISLGLPLFLTFGFERAGVVHVRGFRG